ncbi:MAG: hypothetical protein DRR16_22240 [Candidatus Parabeggiatoa sp. nov. 3]|jgi:hypothetical protein|nr:MAG: hypothetical protein DRR00_26150 [Gammaproteobacteria bacterium]RKZ59884.1 MAG: hypothetical protein DRQ99_23015 [Gammaproteobacteria bacterium]RKZ81383.1 MAG: hypothetical protein DRR16_22240 [Gammaproteobacteria bacterium]
MSWYFRSGKLESPTNSWPAVSGSHGKGVLPKGEYKIGKVTTVVANPPSTDKKGFAWECPIMPTFSIPKNGLGIHPEANVAEMIGGIGLTNEDTMPTYNALKNANGETLMVE